MKQSNIDKTEASFTLFETVIAVGIMAVVMINMAGLQGNIVSMSEYGVQSSKAMGLAKRVMAQVEYYAKTRPFSDMKYESLSENEFEDVKEFTYILTIKDWDLPLLDFFQSGGLKSEDADESTDSGSAEGGAASGMAGNIKQLLGDELLKVAKVEVLWPEGARKNSVQLSYLLTNFSKLDENLQKVKSTYDALVEGSKNSPPTRQTTTVPLRPDNDEE